MAVFSIRIADDGKLDEVSKDIFREEWGNLSPGRYLIQIKPESGSYTPTRYKYYFDCVLGLAFPTVAKRFLFVDKHGETRHPQNVKELHTIIKAMKNPMTILGADREQIAVVGWTTTALNDREFIGEFLEEVVADFSGPPYYAYGDTGCPTWEEWREMRKAGSWKIFKQQNSIT